MVSHTVALGRDGKTIVFGSHDGILKSWDIQSGECLATINIYEKQ